ncbi:MAG: HepT-like ribonuclease domain-containing protein [Candidatus Levyibacteriota bacterium]
MIKNPLLYITHIFDAVKSIQTQMEGITKEQFEDSELIQGFVERKLEIIGEATKRIPDEFKKNHPNIPWKDMAGMRDILIHQYTEVDEDIVWKTITQKIPPLKEHIESILNEISR